MFIGRSFKVINRVKSALKNSGVVICPAYTIYGFSAFLFDVYANRKIYSIKRREKKKPFIVIAQKEFIIDNACCFDKDMLKFLLDVNITVVLRTKSWFPDYVSFNSKTAFRAANTPFLNEICALEPITSTSVNISGAKEISSIWDMARIFKKKIDGIVVDRVIGEASTIVELDGSSIKVLREGFNIEKIKEVIDG